MPSMIRLSGCVAATVFYSTLFAANTAFSFDIKPQHLPVGMSSCSSEGLVRSGRENSRRAGARPYRMQVLASDLTVPFPKMLCQNVFLEGEQGTAKQNVDSQGVILKGYDVVAFFKERKAAKGSSELSATYQNATYLFTSAANKAEFEKDPAKYVPQYGAFCAYGVTLGVLADPEVPDAFLVYKGKLYVCGNQGALKDFKKDIDSNIDKANVNWLQLASQ
jgi:YHS domain-containing protein